MVVNQEHLQNMIEMGFPEVRCRRALKYFNNDFEAALKRLASTADVFIENSRPGAFDRMGLSYEDLKAVNPDIIYVSISGFGSTGPYASRPACKIRPRKHPLLLLP